LITFAIYIKYIDLGKFQKIRKFVTFLIINQEEFIVIILIGFVIKRDN